MRTERSEACLSPLGCGSVDHTWRASTLRTTTTHTRSLVVLSMLWTHGACFDWSDVVGFFFLLSLVGFFFLVSVGFGRMWLDGGLRIWRSLTKQTPLSISGRRDAHSVTFAGASWYVKCCLKLIRVSSHSSGFVSARPSCCPGRRLCALRRVYLLL